MYKALGPWSEVISLGGYCETAWQIRKYTGVEQAHFFDWLITPVSAVAKLVTEDFRHVFRREDLILQNDSETVLDQSNGIFFHHSFSRDGAGKIHQSSLDEEYDEQSAKIDFLIKRWRNTLQSGGRILFICLTNEAETCGTLLCNSFDAAYPNLNYALLVACRPEHLPARADSSRLLFRAVADQPVEPGDIGSFLHWSAVLRDVGVRPSPA